MSHICPWWLAYTFDNRLRSTIHRPESLLSPYIRPGMTVMDAGCGMGIFSVGMARLVGDDGLVISVDIQQEMLDAVERRASKAGVGHRIRTHLCEPHRLGDHTNIDFALAFWMVHEVPKPDGFFRQIVDCMGSESAFLLSEPKYHVSAKSFIKLLAVAENAGLRIRDEPQIHFSRAALFIKDGIG